MPTLLSNRGKPFKQRRIGLGIQDVSLHSEPSWHPAAVF
jgi:hypothetical protein